MLRTWYRFYSRVFNTISRTSKSSLKRSTFFNEEINLLTNTRGFCFLDVNTPISLTCCCKRIADAFMPHHRGKNGNIIGIFSCVFVECLGLSSAHEWYHFWPISWQYFFPLSSTCGCLPCANKQLTVSSNLSYWYKKNETPLFLLREFYIIKRKLCGRADKGEFSSRVEKGFTLLLRSLTRITYFFNAWRDTLYLRPDQHSGS